MRAAEVRLGYAAHALKWKGRPPLRLGIALAAPPRRYGRPSARRSAGGKAQKTGQLEQENPLRLRILFYRRNNAVQREIRELMFIFIRESKKRIACLEAENAKLRDLALKLTSQVRVLREALRDVPSENCRNQRPQVWERYLGSGQPIGLMEKMKHDVPGAA